MRLPKLLKILLISVFFLVVVVSLLFGYRDIPLDELKTKYAQAPSSFTMIDGMNVHFRDEGNPNDSIPIVLIHGTGSSLHTFDDWPEFLKQEYRVVRMDLPAYGLTGPFPDRDYSIKKYVEFIKHFLDEKGIEKCILGGNSLGGEISWRFTTVYPEMVDKLILIDAAGYPFKAQSVPLAFRVARIPVIKNMFTFITPKSIARSSVENVYADKSKVTDELADRYFELTLRAGNRQAFVDRLSMERPTDAYQYISEIKQPTLVLWGDQDLLIPVENAELFHKDLPNDTLVILENAGHVPMEEVPLRSVKVVRSFLDAKEND
ncbi:alpha/beta fold hydrolase [Ekhidna sp.]